MRDKTSAAAARLRVSLAVYGLGALGVLLFSRLHYAPKYLFFFDNANFAFALKRFDPALHQPQPPGYPMFVALLHAINLVARDPNRSLVVAGLLGSAAALALLWFWTDRMFGRAAACMSVALLLLHPVFWLAGVANPVRVFLAVAVTAAGWAAWEAMASAAPARPFYRAAAVLGLVSGFRPEALLLLAPMLLTVALYRKLGARAMLIGLLILLGATGVWLAPMAVRMGGFGPMFRVFAGYVRERSAGYTIAYGASAAESLATAGRTLIWTLGMTVVWIWVLPLVWKRFRLSWDRPKIVLTAAAFLPALLFHALVHVRDIDQTLLSIPVACLAGGVALAAIPSRKLMTAAALVAMLGSYWGFRRPFYPSAVAASGSAIRYVEVSAESTYDALNRTISEPGTVLVWYGAAVPWRNVSYYYPNVPLLAIPEDAPFWVHGEPLVTRAAGAVVLPPGTKRIVLGLSSAGADAAARLWPGARRIGPLISVDVSGTMRLELPGVPGGVQPIVICN